jgi:hypothetical protein
MYPDIKIITNVKITFIVFFFFFYNYQFVDRVHAPSDVYKYDRTTRDVVTIRITIQRVFFRT